MPARRQLMAQGEGQGWRLWLIGSVVATGFHLWALYRPAGPSALSWLPNADKLGHAVIFGLPLLLILITVASLRRVHGRRPTGRFVWIAAAVFAGHAVLSEWIQRQFYSERVGDPYDVVADCTGCALALLGYAWVDRRWTGHVEAGQA